MSVTPAVRFYARGNPDQICLYAFLFVGDVTSYYWKGVTAEYDKSRLARSLLKVTKVKLNKYEKQVEPCGSTAQRV